METLSLFGSEVSPPLARHSDPQQSHQAAATVAPGVPELEQAILQASWELYVPSTPFELADQVRRTHHDRWGEATIRSGVSRCWKAGSLVQDGEGKSPRGVGCVKLRMPSMSYRWEHVEDVPTNGRV